MNLTRNLQIYKYIGIVSQVLLVTEVCGQRDLWVSWITDVFSHVPNGKVRTVAAMLKAIHAQESREAAERKAQEVIQTLTTMKLRTAAALVDSAVRETFTFYAYPPQHWLKITTNNPMERL